MRLNRIPGIGLLILLAGLMHPTVSLNAQDTLALKLIRQVDSVYASAQTYRDQGTVTEKHGSKTSVWSFKTLFVRDSLFRYYYYIKNDAFSFYGFQWDTTGQRTWRKTPGKFSIVPYDVYGTISATKGVSRGTSYWVPNLLMPGMVKGPSLFDGLKLQKYSGIDSLAGHPAFLLVSEDDQYKAWIDAESLLVLRIDNRELKEVTRYEPSLNLPVPEGMIDFNPRKESGRIIWKYLLVQYGDDIFWVIFLIYLIIQRRQKSLSIKIDEETTPRVGKKWRILQYTSVGAILLWILHTFLSQLGQPGSIVGFLTMLAFIGTFYIGSLYLPFPDWLYKRRFWAYHIAFFSVMIVYFVIMGVLMPPKMGNHEKAVVFLSIVGFCLVMVVLMIISQLRRFRKLRKDTPYPDERDQTISASAGLVDDWKEIPGAIKQGRILFFHNRLVIVRKDGTIAEIPLVSIRKMKVRRDFVIYPVAVQMTDYQNHTQYLVVRNPYYWKSKIRRR